MKKYIITKVQFDDIRALIPSKWSPEARRLFESLKPIEPMTVEDIFRATHSDDVKTLYHSVPHREIVCFTRAIEAHTIGG